jgi:hypothetical protein
MFPIKHKMANRTMTVALYAIHDPWFHGIADGDVDDRAAFCAYEHYLQKNPNQKIIVYVGDRYEETIKHYGHFRIVFKEAYSLEDASTAEKISICAPIKHAFFRASLTQLLETKKNGYCQGCKIGCMNFPNQQYMPLLESIPESHRFSTLDTMITFPVSFIQKLDPIYYEDYQQYGYMKLFSPGAIANIPGLLYRLYCPELGGGPGTNMLTIQRCLQKHFNLLPEITVSKDQFDEFNKQLIQTQGIHTTSAIRQMSIMEGNDELLRSITVMAYFANLIYKTNDTLYKEDTPLYSLKDLPQGTIALKEEETPPLYDLIATHAVLYGNLPKKEDLIEFYA